MVDEEPLGGCATFESYMYLFMYLPVFSILQNSILTLMRVYLLFLTRKRLSFFNSRVNSRVFSILQNSILTLMRIYLLFLTRKRLSFFNSRVAWVNNARTMAIYGDAASIT